MHQSTLKGYGWAAGDPKQTCGATAGGEQVHRARQITLKAQGSGGGDPGGGGDLWGDSCVGNRCMERASVYIDPPMLRGRAIAPRAMPPRGGRPAGTAGEARRRPAPPGTSSPASSSNACARGGGSRLNCGCHAAVRLDAMRWTG